MVDREDVVMYVCLTQEDTGHMIECESCSSWSHSECVNVSPTVAANYPFICPYCVKSLLSSVSVLTSDITQLIDRLVKLKNTCKPMSTIISKIKAVQNFLDSISTNVILLCCQFYFHSYT